MNFRILPVLLFFAFALIVAKVVDLGLEKSTRNRLVMHSNLQALAEDKAKDQDKDNKDQAKEPSTEPQNSEQAAASNGEAKKEEPAAEGEAKTGPEQKNPPKSVEISDQAPMEKALLENLSKRRKELDDWANSIAVKESVLNATEKKINNKMEELKKLEADVTEVLAQYKAKEDEKTKRLIKIYENMKPADAAKIFNSMEMGVLLEVVGGMKEDNAAKILAKMDVNKAKELTVKLDEQHRLAAR